MALTKADPQLQQLNFTYQQGVLTKVSGHFLLAILDNGTIVTDYAATIDLTSRLTADEFQKLLDVVTRIPAEVKQER